jgi:hypothetical protein
MEISVWNTAKWGEPLGVNRHRETRQQPIWAIQIVLSEKLVAKGDVGNADRAC